MGEGMISNEQLTNWFTHHPPMDPETVAAYEKIRAAGLVFATVIRDTTPPSADQTTAIRHVRDAVMNSNSAIACGGA